MVRVKHRYLAVAIIPNNNQRLQIPALEAHFYKAVKDVILETHGDLGLASVQKYLQVKYLNTYTNMAIIRTKRGSQQLVSSSLAFLTTIKGIRVVVNTLHVSGTIRALEKFLVAYHQREMPRLLREARDDGERAAVMESIAKCTNITVTRTKKKQDDDSDEDEDMDIFDK